MGFHRIEIKASGRSTSMDLEEYRRLYGTDTDATPGWSAIDERLKEVYGKQEPKHWGTTVKYMTGGPDPIDGISAYECREGGIDHLHFCTYGFSALYYNEEAVGGAHSSLGFEITFRMASPLPAVEDPVWVWSLLQNLGRYMFGTNQWVSSYAFLPTNGPICVDFETDLAGIAFTNDAKLGHVDSPHGRVDFMQIFGITQSELDAMVNDGSMCEQILEEHRKTNPLLVTDVSRKDG